MRNAFFFRSIAVAALLAGCHDSPAPTAPNLRALDREPMQALDTDAAANAAGTALRGKGRIAFVRALDIYVMNANGPSNEVSFTMTGLNVSPSISPDGSRILFERVWNGVSDIYVMNIDGSGVTPLTQNSGSNMSPAWSPSGAQIVFASDRDGDSEIFVMNANGTGVTQLTFNTVLDLEPAWSPDGARIAYATEQVSPGNREIFAMNADGSNAVRLTTSSLWDMNPSWSPDGTRIAYECDRVVTQAPFTSSVEVCVMNADGSGVIAITDVTTAFDAHPTWSLDGRSIAFSSDRDGDYDLYIVKAGGGRASPLTKNGVSDGQPSWGR